MIKYILILAVVLLIVYYIKCINLLNRMRIKVDEGRSGIDVALEKRFDLLTNELEAFKKILQHEKDIFTQTAEMRSGRMAESKLSMDEINTANEEISKNENVLNRLKEKFMPHGRLNKQEKMSSLESMNETIKSVIPSFYAVFEQYPQIYSTSSAQHFQNDILSSEEHLQASRRLYNSNVSIYNQLLVSFPYSVIAGMHHMEKAEFFKADEEKKDLKLNFD